MLQRQEPLDNIKSKKARPDLILPKSIKKEEDTPSHVHVHTPTIVEEVLKSADWDLNLNNEDNSEVTWKIDFDKIILNRNDTNIENYLEKSNNDSMYQVQRVESIIEDRNNIDNQETVQSDLKSLPNTVTVEVPSNITNVKEIIVKEEVLTPIKTDYKVKISDDYSAVNLIHDNSFDDDTAEMRNKLKVESTVRDIATSPTRLSFDAKDFENKIKNQVLTDAPVIIVRPKLNDSMSKSTEAIFSTQPKIESKNKVKKVDRTTSMTEKLYPEKVKANIALYESIKNDTYFKLNKSDSKLNENTSSATIYETYKNERYAKANKIDIRAAYTPQNSVSSDYASINEVTKVNKYATSISVDESKNNNKYNSLYKQRYGSLQFINETIDNESVNDESLKTEGITEMNKAVYRLTFDDKNTAEFDIDTSNNLQSTRIIDIKSEESASNEDIKEKTGLEEIGMKPINEIIHESYEIFSKSNIDNDIVKGRKFGRYRSKYDDDDDDDERMIKSLPIIESGDVKGKVRVINRLGSIESFEERRTSINIKEMPRKLSVLEKIALFEVSNLS